MYFCIAAIIDNDSQNAIRKLVGLLNHEFSIGITASLLPQHISMKISFKYDNLANIENYFDSFINDIEEFEVEGNGIDLVKIKENSGCSGLMWYSIAENNILRKLHNKLNAELKMKFNIDFAEYDGDEFLFHSTIIYGNKPYDIYENIFTEYKNELKLRTIKINQFALFCCHENEIAAGKYYTYKIRNLTNAST